MTQAALDRQHRRSPDDLRNDPPGDDAPGDSPEDERADWELVAGLVGDLLLRGDVDAAVDAAEAAVDAAPLDANLHMVRGQALLAADRHAAAAAALARAMTLGADVEVLDLLAEAVLPGPTYRDHLAALHRALRPATYLEIGVFKGETLGLAQCGTHAIGIDPAPRAEAARRYDAETRIHRITSDAFFANAANDPTDLPEMIDFAFIDGLHLYEQVLRDFINVERHCRPGGVIVLHDTLPVAAQAAARVRQTRHWCGDVWKIVPCLRTWRPDLALLTIPTHPSGLTLVTRLDPASRVLGERFEAAVAGLLDAKLPPDRLAGTAHGDIANDVDRVRAWVQAHRAAPPR